MINSRRWTSYPHREWSVHVGELLIHVGESPIRDRSPIHVGGSPIHVVNVLAPSVNDPSKSEDVLSATEVTRW